MRRLISWCSQSDNFLVGALFGVLATLIQGAWPVVSRLGVQGSLNVYDIAALRFGVAGLLMLPLAIRIGLRIISWPRALFLVVTGGAPYVVVAVTGLTLAPAGHHGVIGPSCTLIFSVFGSWLILGDKVSPVRLLGLTTIICGIVLIGWRSLADGAEGVWIGDFLFVGGASLWASYTVAVRCWMVPSLHATVLVSVLSMLLYLPLYLIGGLSNIPGAPLTEVLLQSVFQGIFVSIIAFMLFTRSIAILGASRGVVFQALQPAVVVVLAFLILTEAPSLYELAGLLFVTAGMLLALGLSRQVAGALWRRFWRLSTVFRLRQG